MRLFSPALLIAGLLMALVVVFSNWLMQGGIEPELPQAFTWLNRVTGQDPFEGVFLYGQFTFPRLFNYQTHQSSLRARSGGAYYQCGGCVWGPGLVSILQGRRSLSPPSLPLRWGRCWMCWCSSVCVN